MRILVLTLVIASFCTVAEAQVTLTGIQYKGSFSRNAKLECKGIVLKNTSKVISVTGDNWGFWIRSERGKMWRYWEANDKSVIGLILPPGKYYVYPNLPKDRKKGSVNLTFKKI